MQFLGLKKDFNEVDLKLYTIKVEASKLLVNDTEYNYTFNRDLKKVSIITDILEDKDNFSKLIIHLSSENNCLLPNSYIINGSKIKTSFKETDRRYFIEKNYYELMARNFIRLNIPLKYLHKFLLNSDYNLINILKIELSDLIIDNNKLTDEELELFNNFNTNHNHSLALHVNDNINNLIHSLFNNCYKNNNADSQIVFSKCESHENSINYDNEKNQINILLDESNFYENACYLIKNISIINDLLTNNNIKNIEIKLPKIEKKEGCCGGSCGAGSDCCQNKSETKENECCKNKPDNECCKKNSEVKCDKNTCDNYESCCGTKEKTLEEKESIIEEKLRKLFENNNINSEKPGFTLFIKGTKDEPKCKYSKPAVAKLNSINLDYNGYNILDNEDLRNTLKLVHPTYPQLYHNYKFVCGGDVIDDKDHESLEEYLLNM